MSIDQSGPRQLASAEVLSVDRLAYRFRMQLELSRDCADLPVLGEEEAANFGNLLRGDHHSLQVRKRVDPHPRAPAATADDPWSMEKEIALRRPRLDQTGVERDEFGVIAWGGADDVIRGMVIGTVIRHVFYGGDGGGSGQAPAVSALTIAMIEAAFLRSLMPEIGGAQLQPTSRIATIGTAVDMASITMRTDEEHPPAAWSPAKALPEKQFHIRQHRSAK